MFSKTLSYQLNFTTKRERIPYISMNLINLWIRKCILIWIVDKSTETQDKKLLTRVYSDVIMFKRVKNSDESQGGYGSAIFGYR